MSDKPCEDLDSIKLGVQIIVGVLIFLAPLIVGIAFNLSHIANKLGAQ